MPPKKSQPLSKSQPLPKRQLQQRVERPLTAEESNLIKTTVNYLNAVMTQNAQLPTPPLTQFYTVCVSAISLEEYLKRHLIYLRLKEHHLIYLCIYVDRFFANNSDYLHPLNTHRVLTSLLLLAIKYTDDNHFNNVVHANCAGVTLTEINKLEVQALMILNYNLYVSKKDYLLRKEFLANYSMNDLGTFFTAKDKAQLTSLNTHNNAMHTPPQATLEHSEGQNDLLLSNPFEPLESEAAASSGTGISQMSSADFADACLASPVTTDGKNTQPISHADFAYGSPLPLPLMTATSGICGGAFPHQIRGAGSSYASTALSQMAAASGFYGSAASQQLSSGGLSYSNALLPHMAAASGFYGSAASQQLSSSGLSYGNVLLPHMAAASGFYGSASSQQLSSGGLSYGNVLLPHMAAASGLYGNAASQQLSSGSLSYGNVLLPHMAAASGLYGNASSQQLSCHDLSYGNVPLPHMAAANGFYRGAVSQQIRSADLSAAYLASPETVMGSVLYGAASAQRMNPAAFLDALYDSPETAAAKHLYGDASRPQMIFSAQAALPLAAAASSAASAVSQEITHATNSSNKLQLPVVPPELHHKKRVREDSSSFFRPSDRITPTASATLFNASSEAQEVLDNNGEQAKPSKAAKKAKMKHPNPPPIGVGRNKQSLFAASMDKEAMLGSVTEQPRN
ncbi:MAG: hypothetical protein P4L65_05355 [Legionella sp.]|nr:hypothetical protein [Legionella sp.]